MLHILFNHIPVAEDYNNDLQLQPFVTSQMDGQEGELIFIDDYVGVFGQRLRHI